jgi:hypothetical protein
VLLERVEDLTLDVPDVPRLLSLILARAIADEAIPPSFLLRLDLASEDQGFKVPTLPSLSNPNTALMHMSTHV